MQKSLIALLVLIVLPLISANSFGYNYLDSGEKVISGSNYSINVTSADYWDDLDTPADITYDEISGGDVNALGYYGYFNGILGVVGSLLMDGDPWYLAGTDLEIDQDLQVNNTYVEHDIMPTDTLTGNIGSGALRWLTLWVQNISAENIDTFTLEVSDNLTVGGNITADTYYGDGSQLTGISAGFENPATEDLNMSDYKINFAFNSSDKGGIRVGDATSGGDSLINMITDQSKVNISEDIISIKSDMNGIVVAPFSFDLTKVGGGATIATYNRLTSEDNDGNLEGRRLQFLGANAMASGAVNFIADNLMVSSPTAGTGGTINYKGLMYDFGDISYFPVGSSTTINKNGIYLERGTYLNYFGAGYLNGVAIDLVGWGDGATAGFGNIGDKISYRQDGGNVVYDHDTDKGYTKYGDNQETLIGQSGNNFIINNTVGNVVITSNLTMYSPDGSSWNCGVNNSGAFLCS